MSVNSKRRRDAVPVNNMNQIPLDISMLSLPLRTHHSNCIGLNTSNYSNNCSYASNMNSDSCINNCIIADIQSAITTKQRLLVFQRLRKILQKSDGSENDTSAIKMNESQCDHSSYMNNNKSGMDLKSFVMKDGGFTALTMQLHHLVHTHGSTTTEIEFLCNCFAIIFRLVHHKFDIVQHVLNQHGSDLLVLLSTAIMITSQQQQSRRHQSHKLEILGNTNLHSVQHDAVSIFSMISSSSFGSNIIVRCRIVMETLLRLLGYHEDETLLCDILGIFKNLTYYREDCRINLIQSTDFVKNLALPVQQLSIKSMQRLSAIIRNLSISVECRSPLVSHPIIIEALIKLLNWESQAELNDADHNIINVMKRNVTNALVSLSMDYDSSLILIFYGDGLLLQSLQQHLIHSSDVFLRKKAACILRLLAHEFSAPLLIHDANLMHTLSDAALRDISPDVRKEAAEAFARCATFVQVGYQPHYDNVLDALTVLVTRRSRLKVVAIDSLARALREQSSHEINQRPMADRSVLLDAIAAIALSREFETSSAAVDACCALMNLSNDKNNLEKLANEPKVLEALLYVVSRYRTNYNTADNGKRYVLITLANLASNRNCRKVLMRHGCLLQSLIQELKNIPVEDRDLKLSIKQATLLLALDL